MKRKKKLGRPPLPRGVKYSRRINARLTEAEYSLLKAEGKRLKMSLSKVLMRPWRAQEGK